MSRLSQNTNIAGTQVKRSLHLSSCNIGIWSPYWLWEERIDYFLDWHMKTPRLSLLTQIWKCDDKIKLISFYGALFRYRVAEFLRTKTLMDYFTSFFQAGSSFLAFIIQSCPFDAQCVSDEDKKIENEKWSISNKKWRRVADRRPLLHTILNMKKEKEPHFLVKIG